MEPFKQHLIGDKARHIALGAVKIAPDGWIMEVRPPKRSEIMNAKMHAMCGDVAKQVLWCGAKLSTEDWKRVATAMLKKDRFIRDVNDEGQPGNGLIVLGARTRDMDDEEIGKVCDWLRWFGAKNEVVFKERDPEVVRLYK